MSQTFDPNVRATQGWTPLALFLTDNFSALQSSFAGVSAPVNPTTGQFWFDISGSPYLLKIYNGTVWVSIASTSPGGSSPEVLLARVDNIDAKSATTTNLLTCGSDTEVTKVLIFVREVSGATVNPTCGVGIASGETDIIVQQLLLGSAASSTTDSWKLPAGQRIRKGVSSDIIKFGISSAASATGNYKIDVLIFGHTL
jgi:hypothetical protein